MSLGTVIIGLAILGVIVLIAWNWIGGTVIDVTDTAKGFAVAWDLKPKPRADEMVCDVRVKVFAELTETLPLTPLFVRIGEKTAHPEIKEYNWRDCHSATSIPIASLIDLGKKGGETSQLALFLAGEKISTQIVLRDKQTGDKIDAHTQPTMRRDIPLPEGLVPLPYDLSQEYLVKNIPARDYELEIYFGREINKMDAGQPFIDRICAPGKTTC